mgnify:CR=1 FL=1
MKNVISATDLKNRVSDILNDAYFHGKVTVIERYGKPIAEIVPADKSTMDKDNIKKALETTFGILPDFPDVTKFRVSRRRKFRLW